MGTCGAGHDLPDIPDFEALVGHAPYPWQRRFYGALLRAGVPDAVDVPTGLGKTSCVLRALAFPAECPVDLCIRTNSAPGGN